MSQNYISYDFTVVPREIGNEILIAELGFRGFESFVEHESGFTAYIPKNEWHASLLDDIYILESPEFTISYKKTIIEQVNWNEEWEKNFEPIQVEEKVSIRAPFHKNPGLKYDIVIEPKMSFGTGHHETTYMMVAQLLDSDLTGKTVLDMGCGTGILAIFAEMKGAGSVMAIDIDPWCYENSMENVSRNNCRKIKVKEGDAKLLQEQKYDLIIANINRNILLNDLEVYNNCLGEKGQVLLSGFYKKDIPVINARAESFGWTLKKTLTRNNWVALKYIK